MFPVKPLNRIEAAYKILRRSLSVPRLAIVGSGPAGMFTCNGLMRRTRMLIDVFENAPVPFGLVRYGVAPDHQEMKNVIHTFDSMFENNRERLRLFCNVQIGKHVSFKELTDNYDAVLLAYGSYKIRTLNIPGAQSKNVIAGGEFVRWYNGVPNVDGPNLNVKNAIVIGNGNVALDCVRIMARAVSGELRSSDIPNDRLQIIETSPVEDVKVLGRRGPGDVSFTIKELREQFKIPGWSSKIVMSESDMTLLQEAMAKMERKKKRLTEVLLKHVGVPAGPKRCSFLFHHVPQEIISDSEGNIKALRVLNKESNEIVEMPCELLIYSIGYETLVLDGIPKNDKNMIDMKDFCRVNMDENCRAAVYATGWCAHGPHGVIVDTQQQSVLVAEEIADDFADFRTSDSKSVMDVLLARSVPFISWDEWKKIDDFEKEIGKKSGKIREKLTEFGNIIRKG
ncbi:unnamed protein product [Caenorhabditis bovis]|uniref:NADPH:adrenodoxin oxidoreductase, mitochondrial n=1 Tax=Caenorhabditis bovis TaxID=2654633 RepID=A0A8S1F4U2_9PELO|nr:unnamed protein product [Caenorhabditis bovis]